MYKTAVVFSFYSGFNSIRYLFMIHTTLKNSLELFNVPHSLLAKDIDKITKQLNNVMKIKYCGHFFLNREYIFQT